MEALGRQCVSHCSVATEVFIQAGIKTSGFIISEVLVGEFFVVVKTLKCSLKSSC